VKQHLCFEKYPWGTRGWPKALGALEKKKKKKNKNPPTREFAKKFKRYF